MNLPYGWNEQYALQYVVEQVGRQKEQIELLQQTIANLEAEVARLDVQKANRAGRKPKMIEQPTAQGDARIGDA